MGDIWLPDVRVRSTGLRLIDATGRFTSPLSGTLRTVGRPGDRWGTQLTYANLKGLDKARMESFIAGQRGAVNRIMFSPVDYVQRGSFPSAELLSNNIFTNGTTGWTNNGTALTLSVQDRVLRGTVTANPSFPQAASYVTATPYTPYVVRALLIPGRAMATYNGTSTLVAQLADGGNYTNSPNGNGNSQMLSAAAVVSTVSPGILLFMNYSSNGLIAGDYFSCPWSSFSQCALVDNAPNLLQQSNAFGTSPWVATSGTATSNNGTAGPDGTLTAQYIQEQNTTVSEHYVAQSVTVSSAAQDLSLSVSIAAVYRGWVLIRMGEGTGNTYVLAWFNTLTGAVGTTSAGANWSNIRTTAVNQGQAGSQAAGINWWRFTLTARKTSVATSISAYIECASADNTNIYAGTAGVVSMLMWHASLSASSVTVRDALTTTSSVSAGTSQTGGALYLKGLPASTNGLLLPGDWCEINGELKKVTAPLNSDASGLGYLQFSPPIRVPPADNDPLIVNKPMSRFIFKQAESGWQSNPGIFSDMTLDLVEAIG